MGHDNKEAVYAECEKFLSTYGESTETAAAKGLQVVIDMLKPLLLEGHEHCTHNLDIAVVGKDIERDGKKAKLYVLVSSDGKMYASIVPNGIHPILQEIAISRHMRPASLHELGLLGITANEIVNGIKRVMHDSIALGTATQAPAQA